jgi:hypothetical protein
MSNLIADGQPEPGMIPKHAVHIAAVISLSQDGGLHVGISSALITLIGFPRAQALNLEIAELFASRVTEHESRFTVDA